MIFCYYKNFFLTNETEVYGKNSRKVFFANSDFKHSGGVAILLTENFDGKKL